VGLPLPPVIFAALKRQVGSRQAERLAAGGSLISVAEAVSIGLIDEALPDERVVNRAAEWCQSLLALPPQAMAATRKKTRADLVGLFDQGLDRELDEVISNWWSDEAQTVLKGLAERLARRSSH
jgi:enoyl-CoA hydratase/carnithine racemase